MNEQEWKRRARDARTFNDRWNLFRDHMRSKGAFPEDPDAAKRMELVFYAGVVASWELMTQNVAALPDRQAQVMMAALEGETTLYALKKLDEYLVVNLPVQGSKPS